MARYFRDISIHLGFGQELPEGLSQKDFNITTHTVQDIFYYMLPKRFEFGNMLKLNIDIKGKNATSDEVKNFGGYVNYSYIDFDFKRYFKLSKEEQNKIILQVLRDVLEGIPEENQENKKIVLAVTEKIAELNFEYALKSKLTKQQRTKKLKAIVEIRINNEGQNAYLRIETNSGKIILETHLLKNNICDFYDNLHKSKWEGDTFKIIDRGGKTFKEFEIKKEANNVYKP